MKRIYGTFEVIFDLFYLAAASVLCVILFFGSWGNSARILAGVMAFLLVSGDSFHLVPRIIVIRTGSEEQLDRKLGRGKQITSITMTLFYLLLWQIGLLMFSLEGGKIWFYTTIIYVLTAVRIFLCLLPQNKWEERDPPVMWGVLRNIPFFLQGVIVAVLYFLHRNAAPGLSSMWLAIALSFAFYLPVVLWSNKNSKIGILMLPKTCVYLWMLVMCVSI